VVLPLPEGADHRDHVPFVDRRIHAAKSRVLELARSIDLGDGTQVDDPGRAPRLCGGITRVGYGHCSSKSAKRAGRRQASVFDRSADAVSPQRARHRGDDPHVSEKTRFPRAAVSRGRAKSRGSYRLCTKAAGVAAEIVFHAMERPLPDAAELSLPAERSGLHRARAALQTSRARGRPPVRSSEPE
jgi:hypothetical protein